MLTVMTSGVSTELDGIYAFRDHACAHNFNDIIVIFIIKIIFLRRFFMSIASFLWGNHILRLKSEILSDDDIFFSAGQQIHSGCDCFLPRGIDFIFLDVIVSLSVRKTYQTELIFQILHGVHHIIIALKYFLSRLHRKFSFR